MELRKSDIRVLQKILKQRGLYKSKIDGLVGNKTLKASKAILLANEGLLPEGFQNWPNSRVYAGSLQIILAEAGHNPGPVDGYYGPLTRNASDWFIRAQDGVEVIDFEALELIDVNPNNFPKETVPELNRHYGTVKPPDRCPIDIVEVPCPWKMGLDWNMSLSRSFFKVHRKVADSLKRILEAVHQRYGDDGIAKHGLNRFSGDFVCRNIRGGSRPSTHAWGIAIDFYGSKNELRRGTNDVPPPPLAHPELAFFWEQWEKEGWYSLGRAEDRDWMHIQAAKGRRSKFFHA